jgi:homoserine acetyltransferase
LGARTGEPVVLLHGTTQSGTALLAPAFGGELFGPGQPLDASRYFIILPDAIGHGKSSKPSDELRTRFPRYNYEDMVDAHPSKGLERISAALLAINSADDERNPPELGVLDREIKRVKNGRALLIPASEQTIGHGTTSQAKFWKKELAELLQSAPRRDGGSR